MTIWLYAYPIHSDVVTHLIHRCILAQFHTMSFRLLLRTLLLLVSFFLCDFYTFLVSTLFYVVSSDDYLSPTYKASEVGNSQRMYTVYQVPV